MLNLVVMVVGSAALWILFVAGIKPEEMIVGAVCILLTAAFTGYLAGQSSPTMKLRLTDVMQIWRVPGLLVIDAWAILCVLILDILQLSPAASLFRSAPFERNEKSPIAVARRILAVAYTTATPNLIILGIDASTSQMLFHQLKKSDVPTMTRRLGAQA